MKSFAERWADKERKLGFESIASTMVKYGIHQLPDSAAPCLTFNDDVKQKHIYELYGTAKDWSDEDRKRLSEFLVIGSDGAGNPICVNQSTKEVLLLDHEDWFKSVQFINSDVVSLAECLLAYLGEESGESFKKSVQTIDSKAVETESFWWYEANNIEY